MIDFGNVDIGGFSVGRVWLAPMAGYTDIAFREMCKSYGAGLTVTEMVSTRGLWRGGKNSAVLTRLSSAETPSCVQLFGSDPADFEKAVKLIDCDVIDINMGCPMPKIVKNGDGAALMKNPSLAGDIVAAAKSSGKTVTVKTRLGYETNVVTADKLIYSVQKAGAAAVTVHGRFAEQRYSGDCDFLAVKKLMSGSSVPIILSGDVCADNIEELLNLFPAVAIGRAALDNPRIFCGEKPNALKTAYEHIALLEKYFDERYSLNQVKKFFTHYFRGELGGKLLRAKVNAAAAKREVVCALDEYADAR